MVGNARFVNEKLLARKLGVTEINIVLSIFARFVFPKFGFDYRVKTFKLLSVIWFFLDRCCSILVEEPLQVHGTAPYSQESITNWEELKFEKLRYTRPVSIRVLK